MMKRLVSIFVLVLALGLASGVARAGVLYGDPAGGWTYIFTGDAAAGGADFTALDGTWSHDNGSDAWDETGIGAGRPGGVSALDGYIRIQEPGDPRDHGMGDPSNRKIMFGHSITNDIGAAADAILDTGVTISFRARIATGAPLDDMHPDTGGDGEYKSGPIAPWPVGGNGYLGHDGGKGNFTIRQSAGDMIISFSLALGTESMKDDPTLAFDDASVGGQSGLVMNNLNGNARASADPWEALDEGSVNVLGLDPTQWHEFWITIEPDATATGTHMVTVSVDGSLAQKVFYVTADGEQDFGDSYMGMGCGATGQMGAFDVDFFGYAPGVIAVPEPATIALLGLGGLALLRKRR
jgi:hypothetical protein